MTATRPLHFIPSTLLTAAFLLGGFGCGEVTAPAGPQPADAPAADRADGLDSTDADCQVVLRQAEQRTQFDGRPELNCGEDKRCWRVFDGLFDVHGDLLADGSPGLLYRSAAGDWYEAEVEATGGAVHGYARFAFHIDTATAPETGAPSSATSSSPGVELVPFVRIGERRVLDGNDLARRLDADGEWALTTPADVCPAEASATLRFDADWSESLEGELVRGGSLRVDYDPARLPHCEGTYHNGTPAWTIELHALFGADETPQTHRVLGFEGHEAHAVPAELTIPTDAERVELWFSTSGAGCEPHYDSDLSRNYVFELAD